MYVTLFTLLVMLFSGDLTKGEPAKTEDDRKEYEVFVIQQRWHTGIVFKTGDIHPSLWPEIEYYTNMNFVDIGWGDEKFYQATGNPVFLAARAILWPTQSVLQVFAFNRALRSSYGQQGTILRIPLTKKEFNSLTSFISDSYKRDAYGDAQTSEVYGDTDHYFLATRKYHLFRTCNTWVAIALKDAGLDVRAFGILNARQLFRNLARLPGAEFMD